jgi:hypothetical protein
MTQAADYIRHNNALLNKDMSAYKAAKMRRQRETNIDQLFAKVDKLEQCIENLNQRVKEIETNGCT